MYVCMYVCICISEKRMPRCARQERSCWAVVASGLMGHVLLGCAWGEHMRRRLLGAAAWAKQAGGVGDGIGAGRRRALSDVPLPCWARHRSCVLAALLACRRRLSLLPPPLAAVPLPPSRLASAHSGGSSGAPTAAARAPKQLLLSLRLVSRACACLRTRVAPSQQRWCERRREGRRGEGKC